MGFLRREYPKTETVYDRQADAAWEYMMSNNISDLSCELRVKRDLAKAFKSCDHLDDAADDETVDLCADFLGADIPFGGPRLDESALLAGGGR